MGSRNRHAPKQVSNPMVVLGRIPANRHDYPGFPIRCDQTRTVRQEWQIVQSQFDLDDSLPGF